MTKIEEKLKKGKIQLQTRNSFFGRLILALEFQESKDVDDKGKPICQTIGVDYKGNCHYNSKFIEELTNKELVGILAHELLHIALLHHFRFSGREPQLSNIAEDICINSILVKDRYVLPTIEVTDDKGLKTHKVNGLVPNQNDEIELDFQVCKITIKDCSTKNAEMIYEEIIKQLRKNGQNISLSTEDLSECSDRQSGDGGGDGGNKSGKGNALANGIKEVAKRVLDDHIKVDKNKMSKKQVQKAQKQIEGMVREALEHSRMRGDTPCGLERLWGSIHEEKFNWKTLLQRYITELLPYDQSWRSFGKKTYGTGIYSPMTLREQIDVTVAIDVSGSIGETDLTDFMSEIVGVANQFKNRIKMTIMTHEDEVVDTFSVFNSDDVKNIKIRGCGGTSFEPVVENVKQNHKQTKCLVWLTDGYGEKELEKQPFEVIWVLTSDGDDELCKNSGRVLWLKETLNNGED